MAINVQHGSGSPYGFSQLDLRQQRSNAAPDNSIGRMLDRSERRQSLKTQLDHKKETDNQAALAKQGDLDWKADQAQMDREQTSYDKMRYEDSQLKVQQMKGLQDGLKDGSLYYAPVQQKQLEELESQIAVAEMSDQLTPGQREHAMRKLTSKRDAIRLNPKTNDTPPPSKEEDFASNMIQTDTGEMFLRNSKGEWAAVKQDKATKAYSMEDAQKDAFKDASKEIAARMKPQTNAGGEVINPTLSPDEEDSIYQRTLDFYVRSHGLESPMQPEQQEIPAEVDPEYAQQVEQFRQMQGRLEQEQEPEQLDNFDYITKLEGSSLPDADRKQISDYINSDDPKLIAIAQKYIEKHL